MILAGDDRARQAIKDDYQRLTSRDVASSSPGLRRLLTTIDAAGFPGAILPGPAAPNDGLGVFYAVADSGAQWRSFAPLVRAFAGVTITDFVGRTTPLDPANPFEAWLAGTGLYVARLVVGPDINENAALQLLRGLVRMVERSEAPERGLPRSTDEVLDALALALAAGHREAAHAEINFLRANWRLDALNLRFLEVRIDAELRDWPTLRAQPFFDDLCRTRRPPRVTTALLEAIYHTSISPAEREDSPAAVLDLFRRTLHGRVGTLLQAPPSAPSRPVATLFALAALAGDEPDRQAIQLLNEAAALWDDEDRSAFSALVNALLSPPPPPELPESVRQMSIDLTVLPEQPRGFSWAATWTDLLTLRDDSEPASVDRARSAILGAVELNNLDACRLATEYVLRLSGSNRAALLDSRVIAVHWEWLERLSAEGQVPGNWREWILLLPTAPSDKSREWAERAVVEWSVGDQLRSSGDAAALADAFEMVGSGLDARLALQLERRRDAALVHVISWVQRDPFWPNQEFLELYRRLFYLLALTPSRSESTISLLTELLRGMLEIGLSPAMYEDTLSILVDVVRDLDSMTYIDQLIDLLEATAEAACPVPVARHELWGLVLGIVAHYASHLTDDRRDLLRDLGEILDVRAELEAALPTLPAGLNRALTAVPTGYRIGIYTLVESVGKRVKAALERCYPGIVVEVDGSLVCTETLTNLARRADMFVLAWRAAKHSATDAITAARPSNLPTIFPAGKGSSSVLAAIHYHLSTIFAAA